MQKWEEGVLEYFSKDFFPLEQVILHTLLHTVLSSGQNEKRLMRVRIKRHQTLPSSSLQDAQIEMKLITHSRSGHLEAQVHSLAPCCSSTHSVLSAIWRGQ